MVFDRFLRLMALVGGGILLLLTGFTTLDVVLRFLFNKPFSGSLEFTEFAMATIVFLAIPYCGWTGGHITVDLFEKWLDRPSLFWLPAFIALAGAALFALIAWQVLVETTATLNQRSNMLRWPHFPFRYTVAFGCAVFALVLLIQGAQSLQRKLRRESDVP